MRQIDRLRRHRLDLLSGLVCVFPLSLVYFLSFDFSSFRDRQGNCYVTIVNMGDW